MKRWPYLTLVCVAGVCSPLWAAPKTPQPPTTIGDLPTRSVELHTDAAVIGGADKAMASYRHFLEMQNTNPQLRAEAMRRLGDLNMEAGELERLTNEVTQLDLPGAEAIKLYSTLLKAYPNYPRNDQVLYQLARAYETTGQSELALATLDQVVRRFPSTRDIAEIQFRRGELEFSAKRYADAEAAYQQVISRGPGGSTYYSQSLYKHGWAQFKQSQYDVCLQSFMTLLDRILVDRKTGAARKLESLSRPNRELTDDTFRVVSIAFTYLDGAHSLDQLLAGRHATPYAWMLYSSLGDLYVQKERYQDAANTYLAFVARDPTNEHSPVLSNQAIDAYAKGGFADLVVQGKADYVRTYGFKAPFWHDRERSANPEVVAEVKSNLKDLAQYYHATAQKSKKVEDYMVAADWYRNLLATFPKDADASETNYLLADALFEGRQYADAATEYQHTAYDYPPGPRTAAAAYAVLVALQKQEDQLPPAARADVHARSVAAGLQFAEAFPNHPESAGVLTRAAQDEFAAHNLPHAIHLSELLLARKPPVDIAQQRIAWTIVGQSHFDQSAYDQAEPAFQHALAVAPVGTPEHADLTERLAAAVYRQGEAKRKANDEAGAAADFQRVATVAPESKIVPTARYDAAASLINSKQWEPAITALEAYRRDYPQTEYGADITRKLAVAYVEAGRGAQAGAEFERIASAPGEDPAVAREATLRAADLYEKAGNSERTTAMLEQFVQRYPTPVADAMEARARLGEMAAKANNVTRRDYWRNEIIKADAAAGAQRTDRTRSLAASAQLALAEPARDAFRAVHLTAPLKKSLAAKKQAMETALAGYKAVLAYGISATTTAATYEMAELYRTLGKDLMASERPAKLSAEEREQFDALLEEQAFPFEEQAIAIHEANAKRTLDGVYDESVRRSYQALAEMSPARYGKTELWTELLHTLPSTPDFPADPKASADFAHAVADALGGKVTDAELDFKQMELGYPNLAEPSLNLAIVLRGAGDLDGANEALQRATTRSPNYALAWNELGLVRRSLGKFDDARMAYGKAISNDANYAPAHRNLGVLLDLYLQDPTAALAEFERYRVLSGEDKPVSGWITELQHRAGVAKPAVASAPKPVSTAPAAAVPAPNPATTAPPAAGSAPNSANAAPPAPAPAPAPASAPNAASTTPSAAASAPNSAPAAPVAAAPTPGPSSGAPANATPAPVAAAPGPASTSPPPPIVAPTAPAANDGIIDGGIQ
jgi:cellulose synthase operon protein C